MISALIDFPKFIFTLVYGLILATLTDLETFALLVGAVCVGHIFGIPEAILFYSLMWILLRTFNDIAGLIANSLRSSNK